MPLVIDPNKSGYEKVLRGYQIEALKMVWNNVETGATSREVYLHTNETLGAKSISRASIINFLNAMCDEGVLTYKEETCKGGMRRKYFPGMDEEAFKKHIAQSVFESLMKDFPEQTISALKEALGDRVAELGL